MCLGILCVLEDEDGFEMGTFFFLSLKARVSCSTGWPQTHSVAEEDGLEFLSSCLYLLGLQQGQFYVVLSTLSSELITSGESSFLTSSQG